MIFSDDILMNYVHQHTSPEPELLTSLSRQTHLKILNPRMISGYLQGRMLKMFVQMIQPKRILEIGTFTGYSALCMAEGLNDNTSIDTIEIDDELEEFIQNYFTQSDYSHKLNLLIGDALEIIPTLNFMYDLVFMDGNKRSYLEYYNMVFEKVVQGGYIIADNVLWDGHVLKDDSEIKSTDLQTKKIKEFNEFVTNDSRVENVLLPLRDGLMIIRKL